MLLKKIGAVIVLLLAIIGGFLIYAHVSYPTSSAVNVLSDLVYAEQHPHRSLSQETAGFLPYWRLDQIDSVRYDLLSEVNFSVSPLARTVTSSRSPGIKPNRMALVEHSAGEGLDPKGADLATPSA
jgi:hypothetical protein